MSKSSRQTAFEILLKIQQDNAYSNITVDSLLSGSALDARDKSFVSALVYGVIERMITIDYQLNSYLTQPLKKLKPQVLVILRLGVYQLLFMDKVPESAAVNESVKLTKSNKCAFASSLVNAVLRKCAKNGLVLPDEKSPEFLSVKYSCPLWLINKWKNEYGKEDTLLLLQSFCGKAESVIRVNTIRTTSEKLIKVLSDEGVEAVEGNIKDSLIISLSGNSVSHLKSFQEGLFLVQDTASQICVKALGAKENETVFDLCSAPGGKSFTTAQHMNNKGKILSFDLYEHRVKLINDGAKRLGIDIIEAKTGDAAVFVEMIGCADRVLCDVPCSGFGIIRRKPEIKYKDERSFDELPDIQYKIFANASRYVKSGGRIIYSTCTLNKKENEDVCERFLREHKEFRVVSVLEEFGESSFVTLMPHKNNSDGFFIASFEKE